MWAGYVAPAMRPKVPCAQSLLTPITGGHFQITEKDRLRQTEHYDTEHRRKKHLEYFVLVNGTEECTIWVAPRNQHYVFHADDEKLKMCKIIKMEEMKLSRQCVYLLQRKVQHAGGDGKKISDCGIIFTSILKMWN